MDDESEATCAVRMGTRARAGCGDVRVDVLLTRSANAGTDAIRAMDIKRWRARGISDVITRGGRRESLCRCRDEKERRDGLIDFAFRSHRPLSHFDRKITLFAFRICVKTPRRNGFAKLVSRRTPAPRELTPATTTTSSEGAERHHRHHLRGRLNTPAPAPGAHIPRRTNPPRVTTHRRQ